MNKYYKKKRFINYPLQKINNSKKNLEGQDLKDLNIFLDMDNTIFLYSKDSNDELSLELEKKDKDFFANLQPIEGARNFILNLIERGANVKFETAVSNDPYKMNGKIKSVEKLNLPLSADDIIFVPHGESKAKYIKNLGYDINKSILIDDYYVNLMDWLNHGGFAVKRTFSGKKRNIPQIKDYNDLFEIFNEIGVS